MENYRSKSSSYFDENMQMERYYPPHPPPPRSKNPHDFRSYSTATYPSSYAAPSQAAAGDFKLKKGKSIGGSTSKKWKSFNDPEIQRKKRVASYKVYSVEGKVKGSFRKSFRWIKDKYTQVVYGW